ncbi:Bifunctional protein GlmU [Streptomyces tendae]
MDNTVACSHVGPQAPLSVRTRTCGRAPGSVSKSKIGTFVEAKNASIGEGTKVPHLSYMGDATIGDFTNIGAASVFVNYDGQDKHHTTIGSHSVPVRTTCLWLPSRSGTVPTPPPAR